MEMKGAEVSAVKIIFYILFKNAQKINIWREGSRGPV
jgi:hypothetical protein